MTTSGIREQQRELWNTFSSGWKKHDSFVSRWLQPMGDKLIEAAGVSEGYILLDAATGTGEPGLSAARRVGKGKVFGCDIAVDMIKIAEEKARLAGIRNYEGKVCDESSLPFPDNYFDSVICRLGIMYFPDMPGGIKGMARVLKPGRKISLSSWAEPPKNPWATVATKIVNEMLSIVPPAGDVPGIFRCSTPGALSALLQQGGLHSVKEMELKGEIAFDSPDHYWEFITGVVAPIAIALAKASHEQRDRVRRSVLDTLKAAQTHAGRPCVVLGWSSWIASATK